MGRLLWEYDSKLKLLKALRAACLSRSFACPNGSPAWLSDVAHQFLWEQNILHRDISAGNILLAKDSKKAQEGTEGFLTDLESARMPVSTVEIEEVPAVRKAGNIMTLPTTRKETFHGRGAMLTVCPLIK